MRNPNLERALKAQPEYAEAMAGVARAVVPTVKSAAPHVTGAYERSIRAVGNRVETTDPFGHIVEWGSVNSPPYAPLRRGIHAAGLRLEESRL